MKIWTIQQKDIQLDDEMKKTKNDVKKINKWETKRICNRSND